MDWHRCCLYLVPSAAMSCGSTYESIVWNDARAKPTKAACEAAWPSVQAQDAAEAQAAAAATANESTIGSALESALTANAAALTTLTAWRTTGPGAGTANLSAAQEAQAIRQLADNQIAALKQLNGLIRLLRRKLDTADAASGPKV